MLDALSASPGTFAAAADTRPPALRIAVSDAFPPGVVGRLAPDVRSALEDTATLLGELGHTVTQRDVGFGPRDTALILGLLFRGISDIVAEAERPERLERRSRAFARPGRLVPDRARERLLEAERRLAGRVATLFDDHDVLLTPVMSAPAARAGVMEGRGATVTYLWMSGWVPFNVLWNSTGPARRLRAGGHVVRRPAARGAARRAAGGRGDAPVAGRPARGRPPVGRPATARVLTGGFVPLDELDVRTCAGLPRARPPDTGSLGVEDTLHQAVRQLTDPSLVMHRVVEAALRIGSPAQGAVVEMVEGDDLVHSATAGALKPHAGVRLPCHGSLSGLSVATGEILRCDDARSDPRVLCVVLRREGVQLDRVLIVRDRGRRAIAAAIVGFAAEAGA